MAVTRRTSGCIAIDVGAPISGLVDACEVTFSYDVMVTRMAESG
jgi:hypothetical protein